MSTQTVHSTIKQSKKNKVEANTIVKRKTLYAAGAGLIPFPIADLATVLGVQVTMIKQIADIYEVEHSYKKSWYKDIIMALIGDLATVGVVSGVKAIPIVGSVVGMFTAPLANAAATYALGRVFIQHFDQGGTLLDFDPVSSRELFNKEYEKGYQIVSDASDPDADPEQTIQTLEGKIEELTNLVNEMKAKVDADNA